MQTTRRKNILYILIGSSFWAVSGSFAQYLFITQHISAGFLVSIRLTLAGICMIFYQWIKRKNAVFSIFKNKHDRRDIFIFSIFGMLCCQFSYFRAIQFSNVATATVLQYLGPAFILFYTLLRYKEKPSIREIIALFCAVGGVFVLSTHLKLYTLVLTKEALFWGIASGISLAIYTLQPKRLLSRYDTILVVGWGMLLSGILLCVIIKPFSIPVKMNFSLFLSLFIIVVFGTIISFSLYLEGIQVVGAKQGSLFSATEPLMATLISVVFLHTTMTFIDIFGFILIVSTVFILSKNEPHKVNIFDSIRHDIKKLQ